MKHARVFRRAAVVTLVAGALWAVMTLGAGALWAPAASAAIPAPPGGPVLVVTDPADRFGDYYPEILRAEGLNEFAVASVPSLSPALLSAYQVVVLAPAALDPGQVSALSGWVEAGGNLVAMRPGNGLAPLLGLGADAGDVAEGYIGVNTASGPGAGIASTTMQFHGTADRRALGAGTAQVAALYASPSNPAGAPAVTLRSVGSAGGQAAAFTYDLARSVVFTRQGNPAAAVRLPGETSGPMRSYARFTNGWLNLDRVHVPQADEQQRLLANLITQMNLDRTPLPRFWYLPDSHKAALVLTGDDHNGGGTTSHFNGFKAASPSNCSVAAWECVRATSYVFPDTAIPNAGRFATDGFEVALHLDTGCSDFDSLDALLDEWTSQLAAFSSQFPGLGAPRTNRTHCIAWSDWAGEAHAALANGVRLDTNYYYWPGAWVQDRPGVFTGSGFPQRFSETDGTLIDVYQATTQLTDESEQDLPVHMAALIDRAQGPDGFYGVFTANMHTDRSTDNPDALVAVAQSRGVPVVSAAQMLAWLDGRNGSSFRNVSYGAHRLRFTVTGGAGARGLQAMVPASSLQGPLSSLTRDGVAVAAPAFSMKGMSYARFAAADGSYVATYGDPVPETTVTGATVTGTTARLSFVSDDPGSTFECRLDGGAFAACASPREYSGLSTGPHTFHVRAIDPAGKVDATPAEHVFTVGTAVLPSGSGGSSGPGEGGPGPRVRISPRRVRITARGTVPLRVRCPSTQQRCTVKLRLRTDEATVASRTFGVAGGKRRVIELTLTRAIRAFLGRNNSLRVTAIAVSRNTAGDRAVTRKTIRLVGR